MQGLPHGRLSHFRGLPTPIAALRTSSGSLCYTTIDLQEKIPGSYVGQFDIGDYLLKPLGIHQLVKRPKYFHSTKSNTSQASNSNGNSSHEVPSLFEGILSARQMEANLSNPNPKGVRVTTNAGQRLVTVEDYAKRIAMDKPKFVIALADEVPYHLSTRKRLDLSSNRTMEWFRQLCKLSGTSADALESEAGAATAVATSSNSKKRTKPDTVEGATWAPQDQFLFGVVLPYHTAHAPLDAGSLVTGDDPRDRTRQMQQLGYTRGEAMLRSTVQELLSSGCSGICVGGLGLGESQEVRQRAIQSVRRAVDEVLAQSESVALGKTESGGNRDANLPSAVPILVQGLNSLGEILHSVDAGADIVSTNLPSVATKLGHAVSWEELQRAIRGKEGDVSSSSSSSSLSLMALSDGLSGGDGMINLWDAKYAEDRGPLMEGCSCHACTHHTRQYIHHLLRAHELLGELLLYGHNQHQIIQLFEAIRVRMHGSSH